MLGRATRFPGLLLCVLLSHRVLLNSESLIVKNIVVASRPVQLAYNRGDQPIWPTGQNLEQKVSEGQNVSPQISAVVFKKKIVRPSERYLLTFFLSAFLRDCSLCWDRWNGTVMPTLDAALLSSSRAGADLGRELYLQATTVGLFTHLSLYVWANGFT